MYENFQNVQKNFNDLQNIRYSLVCNKRICKTLKNTYNYDSMII